MTKHCTNPTCSLYGYRLNVAQDTCAACGFPLIIVPVATVGPKAKHTMSTRSKRLTAIAAALVALVLFPEVVFGVLAVALGVAFFMGLPALFIYGVASGAVSPGNYSGGGYGGGYQGGPVYYDDTPEVTYQATGYSSRASYSTPSYSTSSAPFIPPAWTPPSHNGGFSSYDPPANGGTRAYNHGQYVGTYANSNGAYTYDPNGASFLG